MPYYTSWINFHLIGPPLNAFFTSVKLTLIWFWSATHDWRNIYPL